MRQSGDAAPFTARDITPQRIDQALSARIVEARAMVDRIERTAKELNDPELRSSAIAGLPDPESDEPELSELAILAAAFGDNPRATTTLRRPARSRRRKR